MGNAREEGYPHRGRVTGEGSAPSRSNPQRGAENERRDTIRRSEWAFVSGSAVPSRQRSIGNGEVHVTGPAGWLLLPPVPRIFKYPPAHFSFIPESRA
jgi:hypothetical protein